LYQGYGVLHVQERVSRLLVATHDARPENRHDIIQEMAVIDE
jgi:hypothetical protein